MNIRKVLAYSSIIVLCLWFSFPLVWMFFATFKTNVEIFTPFPLLPEHYHLAYYRSLFSGEWIPYLRQYTNTLWVASTQTIGALCLSAPAGYLFAKYKGKTLRILYIIALLPILLPRQVMLLPLFTWINTLGLIDTSWAVILPGMVTGIGVLYFTHAYRKYPDHLLDLARTEGVSESKLFFYTLPLIKPQLLAYGLIHFILAWHEHLVPLVVLSSQEHLTVSVALASLGAGNLRIPYGLLMVGSLMTVIPTVVLYILLRKNFQSSLQQLASQ